ncbi:hypothetical protein Bca52824_039287 [Brassica carinata]|uniref:Uncharacterized protein n=1 Tax=Brassica carinata TaxID=52824 RepID=A0A8X7RRB8_BRACI|nr:hypothetical protein Bca52824_039287 [Brassica carinata]
MRKGRPQLTLSEPSAMAPSSAPPGVVPPGAVPHASVGSSSAVPAAPAPYVRRREDALLRVPSRRNQPHLHPEKINGALRFGVDPEVNAFIRTTWQGNYWGSWASWNFVPPEKKDQWWHAFIVSASFPLLFPFSTINGDEGLDEPPSYTALARKTHTGKDGSFLDEHTEELALEVEEAVEQMLQDGSPLGDSKIDSTAASNAKRYLLNQKYIKRGKTKKGIVYGLGSVQYKNISASVPIPVSLKRNLDVDMRMSGFETTISEVKEDIAGVKEDFSALKTEINAFKAEVTGECKLSNLKLPLLPQLHNHFSLKLSHNLKVSHDLKVSPKLQFNLNISHNLKLSLHHNISRPITNLI